MAVTDHSAGTAPTWAAHASRVYGPLAAELLAAAPHPVRGRRVLDAGAGTGLVSDVLRAAGARPVAVDLSLSMLRWRAARRPPAAVADLSRLPMRAGAVDDAVAAFVLNHLPEPVPALRELARVVRPGGAVLATVYANSSRSAARDRIDEVTLAHGFRWPDWYVEIKQVAAPRLGTVPVMTAAATEAGLTAIEAVEFVAELASTGPRTSSTTGSVRHTAANGSTAWPPPSGRRCARTRSRPWSRSCTRTDQGWCASVPSASGRSTLEQDRALEKDHLGLPDPRDEPTPAVHDLSVDDDHRRPTPVSSCAAGLLLISRPTACKFPSCATTPGGGWFAPQAPPRHLEVATPAPTFPGGGPPMA